MKILINDLEGDKEKGAMGGKVFTFFVFFLLISFYLTLFLFR